MNIDFLCYLFFQLFRLRGFTKAAHMTNLSQSTVSNRISELEKHFDCSLFVRNGGRVEATASAVELVPLAENLVSTYNTAKSKLSTTDPNSRPLRIGSVHAYYDSFLNEFLNVYLNQDNILKISLYLKHSNEIIQGVVSGKYDIGFSHHPSNYSKYRSVLLYSDELVFVGAKKLNSSEDGISFAELENLKVFHSNLFDSYVDDILYNSNVYDFSIDISSRIIPLLLEHNAFAFMPRKYVNTFINEGTLYTYKIHDYTLPPLEHYIIYPNEFDQTNHPFQATVHALIEHSTDGL